MFRKQLIATGAFFLVLTLGCGSGETTPPATGAPSTGTNQGQAAPDFTVQDLTGASFTLSSLRGKSGVLLTFWATWCPYCVREIPKLKALHEKYRDKGIQVIAVNVASNDPIQKVLGFQKKLNLPYTVLYDGGNTASRLYGVQGIPVSLVIDRAGIIRHRGFQLPDNIDTLLDTLAAQP